MANKTLIKIDKNGSKHWEGIIKCDRCGGQGGADAWKYTGYTCYKCGGTGWIHAKWIERTPEYEAKLAAKRAAKAAERMAEYEKQRKEWEAERLAKEEAERLEEARIKAEKAISQYVGTVGEKITTEATYDHTAWYTAHMGWFDETIYIHTFKDAAGNKLVWKTQKDLNLEEGNKVQITGAVKDHSEYKDEKQTVLTRCKITKID